MPALVKSLKDFLRETMTVEQAKSKIEKAMELRASTFLNLTRQRIYGQPNSPYLKLLKLAGCGFSDLETHVRRNGLEATLEKLAKEGVYLTADEYKGKHEIIRGGQRLSVRPADFDRPNSGPGLMTQSSGTRNRPVRALISLDWLSIRALGFGVFFDAHDLFSCVHAIYEPILPVTTGIHNILQNAKFGITTDRWFAYGIPTNGLLEAWYHRFVTRLVVVTGRRLGHRFPNPHFINRSPMRLLVNWASESQKRGYGCCIKTTASNATRIARTAWEMGVSLNDTRFISTGEPFTESKHESIKRVGANAIPRYSYGGGISVGLGCANRAFLDEVHVNQHFLAMIQHPRPVTSQGGFVHPLLCTTLSPSAPKLLLNVDNGDYATLIKRNCGCALEKAGLRLHLHNIRSYEKLTSEGMNYFYGDLFELLEKHLPSEFGGSSGDYQLVEEEDGTGQTRLTLVVHPEVRELDIERILSRLRTHLALGSSGNRFMTKIWESAGTFRVKRQIPYVSSRGKILPLHILKRSS
jgi:hypothetical protein